MPKLELSKKSIQFTNKVDEHYNALRTNIQLPNFDDFFTTFDIKESDGMWRKPEDRVIIW